MKSRKVPFTSRMGRGERIAALVYLPLHVFLLPLALGALMPRAFPDMGEAELNFLYYAVGLSYMLFFQTRFLRRDFDPLCDRVLDCLIEICVCYGIMLLLNMAVNGLLSLALTDNPNNSSIMDMAGMDMGKVAATAVFLAPIVEELLFRAGIFSLIRTRWLAYAVSILLFSAYHIWGYALGEPGNWIYIIQYVPASFVLCRCYERTNTIWGSIFLHMLINGVSLSILSAVEGML